MTPDHIKRLVGGYATGTLSEKQRKLLFEAALDDQELFDELARDQALKELLDVPGVRQRLWDSIDPPPQTDWWRHPLPWAMGGSVMAVSAGLMALVLLTPSGSKTTRPKPAEVAEVRPPVTAEAPDAQPVTHPQPKLQNEPKTVGSVSPPAAPNAPAPPSELQNEPKPAAPGAAEQVRTAAPPPPAPSPATTARDGTAGAAGLGGSPPPTARAFAARALLPPSRFAFDYSIHDGVLRIVPGSDGYLLVRAVIGPVDRLILNTAHVVRGTPAELRVPDGANSLVVVLSTRPVQEDSTEDLASRAATRTEPTGTVEDQRPSVDSRLEVRIAVSGK